MATINATVSIGSNIMSYATSINKTMKMNKAGRTTGLGLTTGLSSKRYTATTQVILQTFDDVAVTSGGANKVYIRNTGTDKAEHFKVTLADTTDAVEEIGRLYGGDWMLMPWEAASAHHNIYVQPSTVEVMTLEFMIFFE
tara:strand:- start:152 stop:571 length:420 start_codon:yes stop_codon:yes gene_type:complete